MPSSDPLDLELLLEKLPLRLVVVDPGPGYRVLGATDSFLEAARLPREAVIGRPLLEALPESLVLGSIATGSLRASLDRAAASGRPDVMGITRVPVPTEDGAGYAMRQWRRTNSPVFGSGGELRYLLHRVDDVTPTEAAPAAAAAPDAQVRERDESIRRLRMANEQLEAFAAAVSHELKGNVRAIDGFATMLGEQAGESLDPEGRRLLGSLDRSIDRMAVVIEDMLTLSRVRNAPVRTTPVNLAFLARRIVDRLRRRDPSRRVQFVAPEELHCVGDERLLGIALDNLLGNAWKYTSPRDDARVELGRKESGREAVYFVSDNGVGFAMDNASRLFMPFERLHARGEFEGHGLGLATVRRVIERHGGRVWAEAEPGRGATIHFTLGDAAS